MPYCIDFSGFIKQLPESLFCNGCSPPPPRKLICNSFLQIWNWVKSESWNWVNLNIGDICKLVKSEIEGTIDLNKNLADPQVSEVSELSDETR